MSSEALDRILVAYHKSSGFKLLDFKLFPGAKYTNDATVGKEQATAELYVLEIVPHSLLHKEGCFFPEWAKQNVSDGGWKVRKR